MATHRHHQGPGDPSFALLHRDAAGIDIGGSSHWVAIPPDRGGTTVREFGVCTDDLESMASWLLSHGVRTVAMESTSVFWIPVFEVLERHGLEVLLVNAAHVKHVSGRKTDELDCQWLQKLHACGLVSGSFRPADNIVVLRSYLRQREQLVQDAAACVQRMQKALTQMNVQLHTVVTDITGTTGLAIIDALLAGERNPVTLAKHRHARCANDEPTIARALRGTWRDEHLFALRQALASWRHYQAQIEAITKQIQAAVTALDDHDDADPTTLPPVPKNERQAITALGFDARSLLFQKTNIDLTRIPGISATIAVSLISEIGLDMTKWRNERAFCSWAGVAPNTRISGGRKLSSRTRRTKSRVGQALRLAANAVQRTKTELGGTFRRLKARLGAPKAITAVANKIGRLVYSMLKNGTAFIERGLAAAEERFKAKRTKTLQRLADELGYALAPKETAT
jgi:transposase